MSLLRIGGKDPNGNAKGVSTDSNGKIRTDGFVSVKATVESISLLDGETHMLMPTQDFEYPFARIKVRAVSNNPPKITALWNSNGQFQGLTTTRMKVDGSGFYFVEFPVLANQLGVRIDADDATDIVSYEVAGVQNKTDFDKPFEPLERKTISVSLSHGEKHTLMAEREFKHAFVRIKLRAVTDRTPVLNVRSYNKNGQYNGQEHIPMREDSQGFYYAEHPAYSDAMEVEVYSSGSTQIVSYSVMGSNTKAYDAKYVDYIYYQGRLREKGSANFYSNNQVALQRINRVTRYAKRELIIERADEPLIIRLFTDTAQTDVLDEVVVNGAPFRMELPYLEWFSAFLVQPIKRYEFNDNPADDISEARIILRCYYD